MTRKYVIKDVIGTDESDKDLYYSGYTTNGSWGYISDAIEYDSREEAELAAQGILADLRYYLTIVEILSR